ncbi:MAG: hypothetical protein WD942_01495 [Dehalococcoidia bacterium]
MKASVTVIDRQGWSREHVPLSEAGLLEFDMLGSVRKIASRKGQGNLPGYYWFSSVDRLVPYESRLEMFTLLQLDFSGEVVGVLSQPLVLHFEQRGKTIWHVPDFLLSDQVGWDDAGRRQAERAGGACEQQAGIPLDRECLRAFGLRLRGAE